MSNFSVHIVITNLLNSLSPQSKVMHSPFFLPTTLSPMLCKMTYHINLLVRALVPKNRLILLLETGLKPLLSHRVMSYKITAFYSSLCFAVAALFLH